MKNSIIFFVLLLFSSLVDAQINSTTPWTWMKGDNTIGQFGNYGTKGTPKATNKPGARNSSTTWRDNNGDLWLFGGTGCASNSTGYLNDLWKYNPSSNMWVWLKGDKSIQQNGNYGTKGISATANKPGAAYSSVSWTDNAGNLWLYGGFGYGETAFGFLNALWKFNISSNEWTWISGDKTVNNTGIYGTQGIESSTNKPGARYGSHTWVDATGNLWLLGGYGYNSNTSGILNDIWKYNPLTNLWTWIKGDDVVEQTGNYGTLGIASATNKPGARYVSSSWTDTDGNLWLFGGYGYDETTSGKLNDMWKYNPSTNEWTWMSGDKTIDQAGNYGTLGNTNINNKPGARYVSNSWRDANGELWLFGGYGIDETNTGYLNDLWKYSTSTNSWVWIKGDRTINQPGVYGAQGIPSSQNKSGARNNSVSWTDGTGNLWLFGGYGFDGTTSGTLNDLWKISNLQAPLPLHLLSFSGVLNKDIIRLQWESEMETGFSHFVVLRSFDGINYHSIGNVAGINNSDRNNYVFNDMDIRNGSAQKVFYKLQMIDKDEKFTFSKVLMFNLSKSSLTISTFPNPASHSINLSFENKIAGPVQINIIDLSGKIVLQLNEQLFAGKANINIDISRIPSGTYIVSIANGQQSVQQKFNKL